MIRASSHWIRQRLSAVVLIPLTLWFVISVASLAEADYSVVHQWLTTSLNVALLSLFIALSCYHAILGIEVVMEDYIEQSNFTKAFGAARIVLLLIAAASLVVIIQINMGNS